MYIYIYMYMCVYIYIYIYYAAPAKRLLSPTNGYLVFVLASSFRMCLDCEVLKGMFPWRTR